MEWTFPDPETDRAKGLDDRDLALDHLVGAGLESAAAPVVAAYFEAAWRVELTLSDLAKDQVMDRDGHGV